MNEAFKKEILSLIGRNRGISYTAIKKETCESKNLSVNERENFDKTLKDLLSQLEKDKVLFRIKNPKSKGNKKTLYKVALKKKPVNRPLLGLGIINTDTTDTSYKGRGGEYAVMSELLFNGFDANLMSVDKGQDIIARKDSNWYFIQVKTTSIDDNKKAFWKIPRNTVNRFFTEGKMYYVLVARCYAIGKAQNRMFCFSKDEINTLATQGYISQGRDDITITIQYDQDNIPFLHSGTFSQEVTKWENLDSIIGRKI